MGSAATDMPADAGAAPSDASLEDSAKQQELEALLRRADKARDDRLWSIAAEVYHAILEIEPERAPIWVQYGHMLKEAGKTEEAHDAYQQSLKLDPENADTHLQIGHLFKILDKRHQALRMYSRALEIDPTLNDAAEELKRLGAKTRAETIMRHARKHVAEKSVLYFDVTDLLIYFRDSRTPTGIQRISLAVTEAALEQTEFAVALCAVDPSSGHWKALDRDAFQMAMVLSREADSDNDEGWRKAIDRVLNGLTEAPPLAFAPRSVLLNLGSPWGVANYFMAVREAKRLYGIFYIAFVHDTIPLLLPELCEGSTASVYTRWIAGLSLHADLVLANARNTRNDFLKALSRLGDATVPCEVVYPNGDFSLLMHGPERVSDEVESILGTRYALFVGTIEPRKNHMLVLSAWRRLVAEFGRNRMPTLVLAGKMGWRREQVVEFVQRTDSLDGKLKILNDASDVDLQALYKNAAFTVYNSHYEGWGLPVTESLSYGKVPVIPRNSALVESGGKHAVFFDSNSEPSFLQAMRDVITKPETLARREAQIRNDPPVRPWSEVFEQLARLAHGKLAAASGVPHANGQIALGKIYWMGADRAQRNVSDFARAEATRMGNGWHAPEDWGAWTSRNGFQMVFDVEHDEFAAGADEPLLLYLNLRGHRETARLRIDVNGASSQACVVPADRDLILRLNFQPDWSAHPRVTVTADQSGLTSLAKLTEGRDVRNIGVGIRSFMLCYEGNLRARLRFMEEVAFQYVTAVAGGDFGGLGDLGGTSEADVATPAGDAAD